MTSWKTRCFNLTQWFGIGGTVVIALWLAAAIGAPAQTYTTLVSFDGTNGSEPSYMSLVQGRDADLYGTTFGGGAKGAGTLFKITPAGALTSLHSFHGKGGIEPVAGLILATDGNFYGTTGWGGIYHNGTVFKATPGGRLATLYSFCSQDNCADGAMWR